jgi:hypothetical protein
VDDNADRARQRVATSLEQIYGPQLGARLVPVAVYGPPDVCVRGLRDVAKAGAELILFTPFADQAEQMERFAAEVVPQLS